jgi:hypothetical protein
MDENSFSGHQQEVDECRTTDDDPPKSFPLDFSSASPSSLSNSSIQNENLHDDCELKIGKTNKEIEIYSYSL